MKKIVLSLLIIMPYLVSCSSGDAISWNTSLVEIYNKTLDDVEDFEELISLETVGDTTVNRHLIDAGNLVLINADKAIKKFSEGETPSDASSCQSAAVEMLESVKEQINVGLKFTKFTSDTAEPAIDKYADEYDEASSKTAQKVDVFTAEHKKFEDRAGVKTE